jgi:hypothetical protein
MIPPIAALAAWAAVGFLLTVIWPGHRAFTWTFLGATFFMPSAVPESYQFVGLPDLDRVTVIAFGMLPATIMFHTHRLMRFKPYDLLLIPLAVFAGYTSLVNGFGTSDAVSSVANVLLKLAAPLYLVSSFRLMSPAGGAASSTTGGPTSYSGWNPSCGPTCWASCATATCR